MASNTIGYAMVATLQEETEGINQTKCTTLVKVVGMTRGINAFEEIWCTTWVRVEEWNNHDIQLALIDMAKHNNEGNTLTNKFQVLLPSWTF